ncbi:MAG TPA: hypothetical protein VN512_10780 [Clostridia bacterium]|nr:hypothetical protein [Clostridia bacterium]
MQAIAGTGVSHDAGAVRSGNGQENKNTELFLFYQLPTLSKTRAGKTAALVFKVRLSRFNIILGAKRWIVSPFCR